MATVDFVLLWITHFSRLQSCVAVRNQRIPCLRLLRSFAPALPTQEPRITASIAFLVVAVGSASFSRRDSLPSSSMSILGCTARSSIWEKDVCLLWQNMGKIYPDWEQNCYLQHLRMSKIPSWYLCQTYSKYFEKATTQLR